MWVIWASHHNYGQTHLQLMTDSLSHNIFKSPKANHALQQTKQNMIKEKTKIEEKKG